MYTFYLFSVPSFRTGVARLLDLFGMFDSYNVSPSPDDADLRALRSDWVALGADFRGAIATFDHEIASGSRPRQLELFGQSGE